MRDGHDRAMTHDAATADVDVAVAQLDSALTGAQRVRASRLRGRNHRIGAVDRRRRGPDPVRGRRADRSPRTRDRAPPDRRSGDEAGAHRERVGRSVDRRAGAGLPDDVTARTPARSIVGKSRAASSSSERRLFEGYDRERGEAWFAVGSPAALTHGERGAPFRLVFHWMGSPRGRVLAHAGAVGLDGAGVLLVGPGGAGKSSTSLACAEAGFDYLADDYCLVTAEPSPTAFGLYATGKVKPVDLPLYPGLRDTAGSLYHETDDKVLLVVSRRTVGSSPSWRCARSPSRRSHPVRSAPPFRARRRATRSKRSRRARSGNLRVAQLPPCGRSPRSRAVPCYELTLGSDRAAVPDAIRQLLENAAQT